jgi:uncharacterized protein YjbI with pentapeptide repeats
VKVGNFDFVTTNVTFLSDTISMVKGDSVNVNDTYYQLKFTASNAFDILRNKVSTVPTGTKVKSTVAPGKDFMAPGSEVTMSIVGSDIRTGIGSNDLHDNGNSGDEFAQTTLTVAYDATIISLNSSMDLRYDGDADGSLNNATTDYTIYNGVYVLDSASGDVQLSYRPPIDSTYRAFGNYIEDAKRGEVIVINGSKYVLTDNVTVDQEIEIGPAITTTLGNITQNPDNAAVVIGTLKMLYSTDGKLVMYNGSTLLNEPVITGKGSYPYKLNSTDKNSSEFAPYDVYVINHTSSIAKISMVENSQKFTITNDEEGVLGYSSVKVGEFDFATTNVTFLGDYISLVKGDSVDVPDTNYQLKFTTAKGFDILRNKVSTVPNGTYINSTEAPGFDFMNAGYRIKVTSLISLTTSSGPVIPTTYLEDLANFSNANVTEDSSIDLYSNFSNSSVNSSVVFECIVENSELVGTNITNATIRDSTNITSSTVEKAIINKSVITNSTIMDSTNITSSTVEKANISKSTITNATIRDSSNVTNSTVQLSAVIESTLKNVTMGNVTASGSNLTNATVHNAIILNNEIDGSTNATIEITKGDVKVNFTNVYENVSVDDLITNTNSNDTTIAVNQSVTVVNDTIDQNYSVTIDANGTISGKIIVTEIPINAGGKALPSKVSGVKYILIDAPKFNSSVLRAATIRMKHGKASCDSFQSITMSRFNESDPNANWTDLTAWCEGEYVYANTTGRRGRRATTRNRGNGGHWKGGDNHTLTRAF